MRLLPFISRRYLAVIAVALALIMSVLDGTIVNVALPTLSREFGISPSSTIWVVNAYQLTVTMLLLSFSALGDIYGYRRIFLFGTGLFTATSLLCALSGSFPMLVIARIAQGIGAAAIMGVTTALMRIIFPPEHIGRGMSINAMVVAVSIAAGPSIAGLILSFASWHWLFAINLPLGVCAITAGYLLLPENPSRQTPIRRKFDKLGGVCSALTFGLLIYSLEGIAHDENRWLVLIQLLLLLAIGTFFIRRERHEETPILPLDLLRIPIFALSVIASIASFLLRRTITLRERLVANAKVQEGEAPAEDPAELMAQLEDCTTALETLITRINLTNAATLADGETLTAKLARRDCLGRRIEVLRAFASSASATVMRGTRSEIKIKSTLPVAPLQKQIDALAKQLRELDAHIQELNWTTELQ